MTLPNAAPLAPPPVVETPGNPALAGGGPPPGQAPAAPPDRPDWLPQNFKSPTDFAEAYKNLERKLGTSGAPPATPAPAATPGSPPAETPAFTPEGAIPATQPQAFDWKAAAAPFAKTWAEKGTLAPEQYQQLAAMGQPRDLVDSFFAGQQAIVQLRVQNAQSRVGGPEAMKQMLAWAGQNLTKAEIAEYEKARTGGDDGRFLLVLDGINARWRNSTGALPSAPFVGSGTLGTGPTPYASLAQYHADMQKPEYRTDPNFAAACDARASVSPFLAGFARLAEERNLMRGAMPR